MEDMHSVGLNFIYLSPYSEDICAWNVHLHRDLDCKIVVDI
jgi:hypothetical protein